MGKFGLSKTQLGQIAGVGLWPFTVSIVLFSLIIDKISYGKVMVFAFVCHAASAALTIMAKGYTNLYWATFVVALGNGTVEAVTNPVVATLFPREKTKCLNHLHAGWPGGLVLGGIPSLAMDSVNWRSKVGLLFLPVVASGVLMIDRKFPINERVAAGISYKSMLQQVGILGAAIVVGLIVRELGNTFGWPWGLQLIVGVAFVVGYGAYGRARGDQGHPEYGEERCPHDGGYLPLHHVRLLSRPESLFPDAGRIQAQDPHQPGRGGRADDRRSRGPGRDGGTVSPLVPAPVPGGDERRS
jgi:MFS family permease